MTYFGVEKICCLYKWHLEWPKSSQKKKGSPSGEWVRHWSCVATWNEISYLKSLGHLKWQWLFVHIDYKVNPKLLNFNHLEAYWNHMVSFKFHWRVPGYHPEKRFEATERQIRLRPRHSNAQSHCRQSWHAKITALLRLSQKSTEGHIFKWWWKLLWSGSTRTEKRRITVSQSPGWRWTSIF